MKFWNLNLNLKFPRRYINTIFRTKGHGRTGADASVINADNVADKSKCRQCWQCRENSRRLPILEAWWKEDQRQNRFGQRVYASMLTDSTIVWMSKFWKVHWHTWLRFRGQNIIHFQTLGFGNGLSLTIMAFCQLDIHMKTDLVFRQDLGFQRQKPLWSTWNEHHFSFWQGPGGVGGHHGPINQHGPTDQEQAQNHGPIDQEHAQNHTAALEA